MSLPVPDEALEELAATLEHYPQADDTSCPPGCSADMRRYLWAKEKLAADNKLAVRPGPDGSSRAQPSRAAAVASIRAQIPAKYLPTVQPSIASLACNRE